MTNSALGEHATAAWRSLACYGSDMLAAEPSAAISDLIADLAHFCDQAGLDFLELASRGVAHWRAEVMDPDGIGPSLDVAISISVGGQLPDT